MAPFPFRNLGLKFLSVCIAVLLWLVVGGEGVVERVASRSVEYQNLPSGLELVGNLPETVEVRVRGSSGPLSRMVLGDMSIVLDLRTVEAGQRVFNLLPSQVRAPFGVNPVASVARLGDGLFRSGGPAIDSGSAGTDGPARAGLRGG